MTACKHGCVDIRTFKHTASDVYAYMKLTLTDAANKRALGSTALVARASPESGARVCLRGGGDALRPSTSRNLCGTTAASAVSVGASHCITRV